MYTRGSLATISYVLIFIGGTMLLPGVLPSYGLAGDLKPKQSQVLKHGLTKHTFEISDIGKSSGFQIIFTMVFSV